MLLELFIYFCCSCQNNFIKSRKFESSDSENNFWKSIDSSGLILWSSLSKAFYIADICPSSCLHCNVFCCKVNFMLSGDVNFTGAFKWPGFAKEAFLEFTSILNLMLSLSQILQLFSGDHNKLQFLVLKYLETQVALNQQFYNQNNKLLWTKHVW